DRPRAHRIRQAHRGGGHPAHRLRERHLARGVRADRQRARAHRAQPRLGRLAAVEPALVVLLDDAGTPIGTADKSAVHTAETPLHLAFSCHVSDAEGRMLVTRRALTKATWPGVWTNAFCGHPAPGEAMVEAIARRARLELGIDLEQLEVLLPDFR